MKRQIFFRSGGRELFGVVHAPRRRSGTCGVILLHPFGEEKVTAHRCLVNMSLALEERGIPSFRFDFTGHGDSGGSYEEASVDRWVSDAFEAAGFFAAEEKLDEVVLAGLRLGGTLALLAAAKAQRVFRAALLAPVVNGKRYADQLLRTCLAHDMVRAGRPQRTRLDLWEAIHEGEPVNVEGYLVSPLFFSQLAAVDLLRGDGLGPAGILLVEIGQEAGAPGELAPLAQALAASGAEVACRAAGDPPAWKDAARHVTRLPETERVLLEWLEGSR